MLDVGCANGYLLECLMSWGHERGLDVVPFGLDIGSGLIELARKRLPRFADNFEVANAWNWKPARRFEYVYALCDCVPEEYLAQFIHHLLTYYVARGGRLIMGAYGSFSRHQQAFDVAAFLESAGYRVSGRVCVRTPAIARFAWIEINF